MTTRTATILVTDLVGSTELRVAMGEERADDFRHAHDDLLAQAITGAGGTVVKGLGDGVLALFDSSAEAVAAAVESQRSIDRLGKDDGSAAIIRVGLSAGDVSIEDGDCFGTPVIEASRLCDAASGGQILASDLVAALTRGRGEHRFEPAGVMELKGLPDPVSVVTVPWDPAPRGGTRPPFPPLLVDHSIASFVGRPDERATLERMRKEAAAGERRCVMLSGEPGVGKTRLASEVARGAYASGATVLLGRCEEELGLPYQPFVEALAHQVTADGVTADDLGTRAGELVRLYPQLADLVPGIDGPSAGDPDLERHLLFEAVASWLDVSARGDGLVLVLDDLHWAGKPTLLLLRHLLRGPEAIGLLIIGTYRDTDLARTHPLADLLADLRREPGVERVPLGGLTGSEIEEFVAAAAGEELDDQKRALAAAVHAETEGNAFFVGEVLRNLAESGAIVQRDGSWEAAVGLEELAIPEGVREVIGRRITRLSDEVEDVLRWASVIGRDLEFSVLSRLVDQDETELLAVLDDAIDARLIEEAGVGRYRFVHALVRSTLLEELRTTRRVRMHAKIAAAIEAEHPGDVTSLAHHYQEAASAGLLDKALDYSARAGRQAQQRSAFDEAAGFYQQALDLAEGEAVDPARHIDLLIGLGQAQRASGEGDHEAVLLDAADRARAIADGVRMTMALSSSHRGWALAFDTDEVLLERARAALDLLGEGGDVEVDAARVRLLGLLALESVNSTDRGQRWSWMDEAIRLARSAGDQQLLAEVLSRAVNLDRDAGGRVPGPDHRSRAEELETIEELRVLAGRTSDFRLRAFSAGAALAVHHRDGELDVMLDALGAYRRAAEASGEIIGLWAVGFSEAAYLLTVGDHVGAEAAIDEALRLGEQAGEADALQFWGNQMFFLRRQQGRPEEMFDFALAAIDAGVPGLTEWTAHTAWLHSEAADPDGAEPLYERSLRAHLAAGGRAFLPTAAALAHVASDRADAEAAVALLEKIAPASGQLIGWHVISTFGPADLLVGRLLHTLGRHDEAASSLAAAASMCEASGMAPFLAETRLHQGAVAAALGDHGTARDVLEQARTQAEQGDYRTTLRRADALLADLS